MHCKNLSVVPYKALEKFSKALYGTTGSTYSARVFRPVMFRPRQLNTWKGIDRTMEMFAFWLVSLRCQL